MRRNTPSPARTTHMIGEEEEEERGRGRERERQSKNDRKREKDTEARHRMVEILIPQIIKQIWKMVRIIHQKTRATSYSGAARRLCRRSHATERGTICGNHSASEPPENRRGCAVHMFESLRRSGRCSTSTSLVSHHTLLPCGAKVRLRTWSSDPESIRMVVPFPGLGLLDVDADITEIRKGLRHSGIGSRACHCVVQVLLAWFQRYEIRRKSVSGTRFSCGSVSCSICSQHQTT